MSNAIKFDRKPYTVTYMDLKGEKQTIRRRPPAKAHSMLPKDIVTLNSKRNDDFDVGDEFAIKNIAPRQVNTLQLEGDDGKTTFVNYFDVQLEEKVALRDGVDPKDAIENNEYLMWP